VKYTEPSTRFSSTTTHRPLAKRKQKVRRKRSQERRHLSTHSERRKAKEQWRKGNEGKLGERTTAHNSQIQLHCWGR
jgi:hypothetical protein